MGRLDDSRQPGRATDDIDRAHLRDPADDSFVISRYLPPDALQGWIRRYWVPVWDVPEDPDQPDHSDQPDRPKRGRREQKVLQYPVTLAVVSPVYARFVGPRRGLSITVLEGRGWAFGVMLAPAAGTPLQLGSGGSLAGWPIVVFVVGLLLMIVLITRGVRGGDILGRICGEEFGAFLVGATAKEAEYVAERIRREVELIRFRPLDERTIPLTVSSISRLSLASSAAASSRARACR